MAITVLGGTKVADTTFSVANSCRFNDDDSAKLAITPGSAGNRRTWTISAWVKKTRNDDSNLLCFFGSRVDGSDNVHFGFSGDQLELKIEISDTVTRLKTNRKFLDPSAWYHIVAAVDTEQSTASNRVKFYVNGVQESSFATEQYPAEDGDTSTNNTCAHTIGDSGAGSHHIDCYLAEVCLIDGSQLAPTSFGEFDEDSPTIWKPIKVTGLTFGTNGFYLDFEASGTLGNDANGGTDLTATNLTATDQCQDSPTNNFCTMNPLDNVSQNATFSQGNTVIYTDGGAKYSFNTSTFFLTKGKWYFEVKVVAGNNSGNSYVIGISDEVNFGTGSAQELGHEATQWAYYGLGHIRTGNANTATSDYNTYTDGDIISVYLDLDNAKLYFAKNGTIENSTGVSITAPSSLVSGGYFLCSGYFDGDASSNAAYFYHNFGNGDYNATAVSSSNADDDGFGLFEYDPTSGTFDGASKKFYALCTKNLATYG